MFTRSNTVPVERGCGTRAEGGIYAESGLGPNGLPLEFFIPDRIVPINAEALGLAAIGVKLIQSAKTGVWHIFDIVGAESYPNPADWLEETRRYGASRRLSPTLPYHLLTSESRMFILHSRAYVANYPEYYNVRDLARPCWQTSRPDHYFWQWCPHVPDPELTDPRWVTEVASRQFAGHRQDGRPTGRGSAPAAFCPGLWWEDLRVDDRHEETRTGWTANLRNERDVAIHMPSFSYYGRKTPYGVRAQYKLAVMAIMPITNLIVVDGGEAAKAIDNLEAAGFVVDNPAACADNGRMPAFTVDR